MIVLDTVVLVYAKGAEHPRREPCRELVAAIAEERIEATTTGEVIQEFVHRLRQRRRGRIHRQPGAQRCQSLRCARVGRLLLRPGQAAARPLVRVFLAAQKPCVQR
jgi:predicted nucleic acid-binding protein